jgi:uncharacterized protein (AIM24 family)
MDPRPTPAHSLQDFLAQTAERDHPGDVFELESDRMLEVHVGGGGGPARVWSKLGAMVAYRGALTFKREGMLEGGIGKALMKAISGEMAPLARIEGQGTAYLADAGKHVTVLRLSGGEAINVSGNDLLAFEDSVAHRVTMHRRVSGMMAGGLFSAHLSGQGLVAICTHGRPLTLRVTPERPVVTDPNATVAWSAGLSPELKADVTLRTLVGRGGGETFQMVFRGDGFVVIQPFEEKPELAAQGPG